MKLLLSFNVKTCSNHPSPYSALLYILKVSQPYIKHLPLQRWLHGIKFYPETTGNI